MFQEKRLNDIMNYLNKKKRASSTELANKIFCSISTLRRDLIKLEQLGLVKRVPGGVVLNLTKSDEPALFIRETSHISEKKNIANLALDFIGSGMCIFLDSSSTVQQLTPLLEQKSNIITLTNGLQTALSISQLNDSSIRSFMIGGEVRNNSSSVVGTDFSSSIINNFSIDLAFFSCRGLDNNGVYEASLSQATIKQQVLQRAKNSILLVDDSKFCSSHFFKIADLSQYSTIISNKPPKSLYLDTFEENNIELLIP